MLSRKVETFSIDVDDGDRCAQGGRNLDSEPANAAGSYNYRDIFGTKACPSNSLIGRRHCVCNHRQHLKGDTRRKRFGHGTEAARGHEHVRGKASITVIARHELPAANGRSSGLARRARPARNHGRNNHRPAKPFRSIFSSSNDTSRYFMPQDKRQGVAGWNAVECKAHVCVADAAARNCHDDIARAGVKRRELGWLQRCLRGDQLESVCTLDARGFDLRSLTFANFQRMKVRGFAR
jgi:hypothetical protein